MKTRVTNAAGRRPLAVPYYTALLHSMASEKDAVLNGLALALSGIGLVILFAGQFLPSMGVAWNPNRFYQFRALAADESYHENERCQKAFYYIMATLLLAGGSLAAVVMNGTLHLHSAILWTMVNFLAMAIGVGLVSLLTFSPKWSKTNPLTRRQRGLAQRAALPGLIIHALGCTSLGLELALVHEVDWLTMLGGAMAGTSFYFVAMHRLRVDTRALSGTVAAAFWVLSWTLVAVTVVTVRH